MIYILDPEADSEITQYSTSYLNVNTVHSSVSLPAAAEPEEALPRLAGRLGLVHLARHLTHRMRGQRAATSAGQEGEMPPEPAQKNGQRAKLGDVSCV